MSGDESNFGPTARRLAAACGGAMILIAALVLIGWAAGSTLLTQVDSSLPAMKPLAAVAIGILGAAIVLLAPGEGPSRRHRAGTCLGAVTAVIGVAVIAEYLVGDLSIDQLFFDTADPGSGRPVAYAAGALAIGGAAAATLDRYPPRHRLTLTLQAIAAVAAIVALVGFAYDVDYLRGRAGSAGVSLQGTVALALAASALSLARPQRGLVAFLSGDDPASTFARRLAPVAILVPLVLGGVRLALERADLFGDDLGLAIVSLGTMAILVAVIGISARDLRRQAAGREARERCVSRRHRGLGGGDRLGRRRRPHRLHEPGRRADIRPPGRRPDRRPAGPLMPERYRDRHKAGIERYLETGEARIIGDSVELAGLRADGSEFPISLTLTAWDDGSTHFTAAISDITARLAREQETRELAAIVASSGDAVIGWSFDGRVRSWNRGAERIYGYSAEEMIGRSHRRADAAGPGERALGADRQGARRRAGRELRDGADAQGPAPDRGLADRLAGARPRRPGDRRLDDHPRHLGAEGGRAQARRERRATSS